MNISDVDLNSIDLDSVRLNIKRASRASYPLLTLEYSEWERMVEEGNTHILLEAPDVKLAVWSARQYMNAAARELDGIPLSLASLLLKVAMSDQ
jgi:hypothetical protein